MSSEGFEERKKQNRKRETRTAIGVGLPPFRITGPAKVKALPETFQLHREESRG